LRFEGAENQYSYRFGTTGLIESSFRDFAGYVEKSADPVTRLRTLRVTFPDQDPIVFVERPDVYPASESHQIDLGHKAFQQLLTDFAVPEGAAKQYVTWLVEQQLGTASGDTGPAVKIVRRFLNDLNNQATKEGRPLVDVLLDVASTGRLAREHAAEAAVADQLEAAGIRTDPTWLDARTDEVFKGLVGEMLALQEAQARASAAGQVVLRSVHLKGSLFVDRAQSELYLADVDVVPEIDLALVSEQNSAYTLHEVQNVKGFSGGGGAADASNQNTQSLAVLRGGMGKPQQVTTREGKTLWAVVSSITATDTTTNSVVDLTGRITEVSGGAKTETVGPKGAKSFTQQLKVNARQIELIVRILRERSNTERMGFK
jgi:hypothetical protein